MLNIMERIWMFQLFILLLLQAAFSLTSQKERPQKVSGMRGRQKEWDESRLLATQGLFLNFWSKVAAETTAESRPPKHLLSHRPELFICWSRWMYVSVSFALQSPFASVCVCVLGNWNVQWATTTKWSAGLWNSWVAQMKFDGVHTQNNCRLQFSNSGQPDPWHPGCC